ncbi:MAG: signal peptidase I [Coprobacillaceae bacterium]
MEEVIEKQKKNVILEYIKVIVITLVVTYFILFFIQISQVQGSSMEPTYEEGNIVIVEKVFYKMGDPSYNDVIVIDSHVAERNYIKRVIGLAGDHLEIKDGKLYRNGDLIEEDYIKEPMLGEDMIVDIPEGKVFVMGDNRNRSSDSRELGYFDVEDDIVGKVIFTLF